MLTDGLFVDDVLIDELFIAVAFIDELFMVELIIDELTADEFPTGSLIFELPDSPGSDTPDPEEPIRFRSPMETTVFPGVHWAQASKAAMTRRIPNARVIVFREIANLICLLLLSQKHWSKTSLKNKIRLCLVEAHLPCSGGSYFGGQNFVIHSEMRPESSGPTMILA